ncbi:hypothetical protein SUGI_0864250 [Cryptomeria japonica]|nr:hypothetical protein SUGI_0864250 [Cryptomeria japonica]
MGNKFRRCRQILDEQYTRPQGLHQHRRQLILDEESVPYYRGGAKHTINLDESTICFLDKNMETESEVCLVHPNDEITQDGSVDIQGNSSIKKKSGNWKACSFILGNECFVSIAYCGVNINMVNYLIKCLHQGNSTAANNVTNWSGTCSITPIIGAFMAYTYWGRYWAIAVFSIIFFIGMAWLTISAELEVSPHAYHLLEQTNLMRQMMLKRKGRVHISTGTVLYRHQKSGGSALTRIAQVIVASFRKRHIQVPDDNSLLYEVQDKDSAIEGSRKLEHTDGFLCLDKAATETENEKCKVGNINPWRLCTVTQVEELKSIIRFLPILASAIIFTTAYSQMCTLFVEQGNTMDVRIGSHFKIPPASLTIFDILSVIFWVPVYDFLIVPFARKYTGHEMGFTHLQRMGIGLVISIFAMVVAAFVEIKRLKIVAEHNYYEQSFIPMSIFWQIPQYFLIGAAEIFTYIGQLEFFYDQAPDAMRSLCGALALISQALGSYLSTVLVTIVTRITTRHGKRGWIPDNLNYGHIDYFFWLLAILSFLNFLVYLLIANWYVYKRPIGVIYISKQDIQKAH